MSDYIVITDYSAKDALLTGNPAKLVKGTEIKADFDAVAVAVATKHDSGDIGVAVQAYDSFLTSIAALGTAADKMIYTTAANTAAESAITTAGRALIDDATASDQLTTLGVSAFAKTILDDADEATFKTTVNLEIGVDVQAYDADIPTVSASQGEMEAGTEAALRSMSPLRVAQAIAALGGGGTQIQPISASVGSNALTISASALSLDFRSATLTSGTVTTVSGTPANLVISSGSTLGTVNAVQSRIAVLAMNNAGTIELAAVNISGGNDLTETGVISTTAEGGAGAADTANVIYSTTARSNLAYRVIGYIESTQTTAGTWATAPSTIQGAGGNAVTAMSSFGYGQVWSDVTGSRVSGTTYYNTTGKPIMVMATHTGINTITFTVGGVSMTTIQVASFVVPPGMSYSATLTISKWNELR
jgi:hypothetical protein